MNGVDPREMNVLHDPENSNIYQDALFYDTIAFKKVVRHYAMKKGFEKARFIAKCKFDCILFALKCLMRLAQQLHQSLICSWEEGNHNSNSSAACLGHDL